MANWKQKIVAYIGEQSYSYWDGSEGNLYYHDVSKLILNLVYIYINAKLNLEHIFSWSIVTGVSQSIATGCVFKLKSKLITVCWKSFTINSIQ